MECVQKSSRAVVIALFVLLIIAVGAILLIGMAWRRVIERAVSAKIEESAQEKAKEVMHAPDDDISRRINELRERGRSGK